MQQIGDKVKKIRELKNFTQDYVAKQLICHWQIIQKLSVMKFSTR